MIDAWPGLTSQPAAGLIEDSLVLLDFLPEAGSVVDVGTGGGLPGLPLKIRRPGLDVTLVEKDHAKAAFLVHACATLRLSGVHVAPAPAEEVGRDPRYRETFDFAVARALAPLPVLVELCLPLVRVGGRMLAQKTEGEDLEAARPAIAILGGSAPEAFAARSSLRSTGTVVVVDKIRPTPDAYPRRSGIPARRPLR